MPSQSQTGSTDFISQAKPANTRESFLKSSLQLGGLSAIHQNIPIRLPGSENKDQKHNKNESKLDEPGKRNSVIEDFKVERIVTNQEQAGRVNLGKVGEIEILISPSESPVRLPRQETNLSNDKEENQQMLTDIEQRLNQLSIKEVNQGTGSSEQPLKAENANLTENEEQK